jgi:hypothetical protein
MLGVHPLHHAASTWRDFFIHIISIVIGLLVAIDLEQTVEAIRLPWQQIRSQQRIVAASLSHAQSVARILLSC